MPKSTFYRISEDKQKRIINAARNEFLSVPYSEVSINKIIKEADIPRGSFYQYFDGKEDLLQCVLEEHKNNLFQMLMVQIEKFDGNMFQCIENNIDRIIEFAYHDGSGKLQMLFSEPWVFETMWRAILKDEHCRDKVSTRFVDKINKDILDVENEEELFILINILGIVVRDSICKIFFYNNQMDESEAKKVFHAKIRTLERHYRK